MSLCNAQPYEVSARCKVVVCGPQTRHPGSHVPIGFSVFDVCTHCMQTNVSLKLHVSLVQVLSFTINSSHATCEHTQHRLLQTSASTPSVGHDL